MDTAGNLYVLTSSHVIDSDINGGRLTSGYRTLRRISPAGIITTIAGNDGNPLGNAGDGGPAGTATLDVDGIAVDTFGNIFLSSADDESIRAILNFEPQLSLPDFPAPELPSANASVSLTAVSHASPTAPYSFRVTSDLPGVQFTVDAAGASWLRLQETQGTTPATISFTVDPAALEVGPATARVLFSRKGAPAALVLAVSVNVLPKQRPKLDVEPAVLSMSSSTSQVGPLSQTLRIFNAGSDSLTYAIAKSGAIADRVALSATGGAASASQPASLDVAVNTAGLAEGAYTVNFTITGAGSTITVPLAVNVTNRPVRMQLSKTGMTFTGVKGGGVTPGQSFAVLNGGSNSFEWTAVPMPLYDQSASTSPPPAWFSLSAKSGVSSPNAPSLITVSINPAGLAEPRAYFGLVRVSSSETANATEDLLVVFNYLNSTESPGAVADKTGLFFVMPAGNLSAPTQTITVTNLNATALSMTPAAITFEGVRWLTVLPSRPQQSIPAGANLSLTVATTVDNLVPGVYRGTVVLQFATANIEVAVRFIVTPPTTQQSTNGRSSNPRAADDSCSLIPLMTSLSQAFHTYASWPSSLDATVYDSCGNRIDSGTVKVSLSTHEETTLQWVGNGLWQGRWTGASSATELILTLSASLPPRSGSQSYTGTLQANTSAPALRDVEAIAGAGTLITLRGSNLAPPVPSKVSGLPLSNRLVVDSVTFNGQPLPMIYASPGAVTALVPYDLPPDTYHFMVRNGAVATAITEMVVVPALPRILTVQSGPTSQDTLASLWNQFIAGQPVDAGATTIHAGDRISVYCSGLGPLDKTVDETNPRPDGTANVASPVFVKIGETVVQASLAILSPDYAGLYAVEFVIPPSTPAGDSMPLSLSVWTSSPENPAGVEQSSAVFPVTVKAR
jgi:uncharacterized protein (TIGR03437 family)